jgi:hypothetical protein
MFRRSPGISHRSPVISRGSPAPASDPPEIFRQQKCISRRSPAPASCPPAPASRPPVIFFQEKCISTPRRILGRFREVSRAEPLAPRFAVSCPSTSAKSGSMPQ